MRKNNEFDPAKQVLEIERFINTAATKQAD